MIVSTNMAFLRSHYDSYLHQELDARNIPNDHPLREARIAYEPGLFITEPQSPEIVYFLTWRHVALPLDASDGDLRSIRDAIPRLVDKLLVLL